MITNMAVVDAGLVTKVLVVDSADQATIDHFGGILLPEGSQVSVGWAHDGTTFRSPAWATLESAQGSKNSELTEAYQAAITADIDYLGFTFQADEESQALLVKATGAGAAYAPSFWQSKDNVPHSMDFTTLLGLYGAMLTRGTAAFIQLQTKKAAVRAATTIQQVEAITWN